jgi:hypothetical protein
LLAGDIWSDLSVWGADLGRRIQEQPYSYLIVE